MIKNLYCVCTKTQYSLILNLCRLFNNDVGIENFAVSAKYRNHSLRSTFIKSFLFTKCNTEHKLDWRIKNSEPIETFFKKGFYHSLGLLLMVHLITITVKG